MNEERKKFVDLCDCIGLVHYARYPENLYEKIGQWFYEHKEVTCAALRAYKNKLDIAEKRNENGLFAGTNDPRLFR